jgi:hypothetical protein
MQRGLFAVSALDLICSRLHISHLSYLHDFACRSRRGLGALSVVVGKQSESEPYGGVVYKRCRDELLLNLSGEFQTVIDVPRFG